MRHKNNSDQGLFMIRKTDTVADLPGYQPSDRALFQVAKDYEHTFTRLNRGVLQVTGAEQLAMRSTLSIAATYACAEHFTQMVPSAAQAILRIAEQKALSDYETMVAWRKGWHDEHDY